MAQLNPPTSQSQAVKLSLRALADMYEQTLKCKLACESRLRAVAQQRDMDPGCPAVANHPLLAHYVRSLADMEGYIEDAFYGHPARTWWLGLPGLKYVPACRVIGVIPMEGPFCKLCGGDLVKSRGAYRRCPYCYSWWRKDEAPAKCPVCVAAKKKGELLDSNWVRTCSLCGNWGRDFSTFSELRVFGGLCPGRNKHVKGQRSPFNSRLKTSLYVAFGLLLKGATSVSAKNKPSMLYPTIYNDWRKKYEERYGTGNGAKAAGWPNGRQHLSAKNKMMDVFLSHLWRVWREEMGWPVRSLYQHAHLGHVTTMDPWAFSSRALALTKGL